MNDVTQKTNRELEKTMRDIRLNRIRRALTILFTTVGCGYFFGLSALTTYSQQIHRLAFAETTWFRNLVVIFPTLIIFICTVFISVTAIPKYSDPLYKKALDLCEKDPGVWNILPWQGRITLIIFGTAFILGMTVIIASGNLTKNW